MEAQAEWLIPVLTIAFVVGLALRYGGELPDPVATAWQPDGVPMELNHRAVELVAGTGVTAAAAIGPLVLADRARSVRSARALVVAGHTLGVLLAGYRWRLIMANVGAAGWEDATTTAPVAPTLLLGVIAGLFGWWVSAHRRVTWDSGGA